MPSWVDPAQIEFKISPHNDLLPDDDGDWDVARRHPLSEAVKHRSIAQRYVEGRDWADTDLFVEVYAERLKRGPVRGELTMDGLLMQYRTRVDGMFADLKANGFRLGSPLPVLLIGRNGEVFAGNQGNHRLAMAKIIGLERIAGVVICKHRLNDQVAAS